MRYPVQRSVAVVAVLAAFVASAVLYPDLPAEMATHWSGGGEVNDRMPRAVGAFLLPVLAAVLVPFLLAVPRIDPRRANVEQFRGAYEWFVAGMAAFLAYVHGLVLLWNLDVVVAIGRALAPAVAVLFVGVGLLLRRAESNWFIGIRTPWTLEDEAVWRRTHDVGGLAFVAAGLLSLGGVVWPELFDLFVLAPTLGAAVGTVLYSYLLYRRRHGPAA